MLYRVISDAGSRRRTHPFSSNPQVRGRSQAGLVSSSRRTHIRHVKPAARMKHITDNPTPAVKCPSLSDAATRVSRIYAEYDMPPIVRGMYPRHREGSRNQRTPLSIISPLSETASVEISARACATLSTRARRESGTTRRQSFRFSRSTRSSARRSADLRPAGKKQQLQFLVRSCGSSGIR
jgi:hypothetical protein